MTGLARVNLMVLSHFSEPTARGRDLQWWLARLIEPHAACTKRRADQERCRERAQGCFVGVRRHGRGFGSFNNLGGHGFFQ